MHYKPLISYNGHAYVDLALPSGTKWATMNIGAEKETDAGLYFAWGETQGYSGSTNEKKFTWNDYKYGTRSNITKYNATDGLETLEASDDAATVNWGAKWKMPTAEQISELLDTSNCTNEWVKNYNDSGVNGCLFTSVRNGNKLFIPAAGNYYDDSFRYVGEYGRFWSNSRSLANYKAKFFESYHAATTWSGLFRCVGLGVRPVFA